MTRFDLHACVDRSAMELGTVACLGDSPYSGTVGSWVMGKCNPGQQGKGDLRHLAEAAIPGPPIDSGRAPEVSPQPSPARGRGGRHCSLTPSNRSRDYPPAAGACGVGCRNHPLFPGNGGEGWSEGGGVDVAQEIACQQHR
jgi:hypothetical protein